MRTAGWQDGFDQSANGGRQGGRLLLPGASRSGEKVQGILLPGSPGGRWNPLLLPGGVRPRFCLCNLDR